jgi:hypothetical protein
MAQIFAIPHNHFQSYAEKILALHINGYKKIRRVTHQAETMLSGERIEYQGNDLRFIAQEKFASPAINELDTANIDDPPITQAEWSDLYSEMMVAIDSYALTTAYFLKIGNHINVVKTLPSMGNGQSFSTPLSSNNEELTFMPYLSLNVFGDTDYVIDILNQEIDMAFGILDQIKLRLDQETRDFLASDQNKEPDKFASRFYGCVLTEKHQYHSRVEYLFFEKYGIPLGIIGADNHVSKYILRQFQDMVASPHFPTERFVGGMKNWFPSIAFTASDTTSFITGQTRYNFMTFAHGPIKKNDTVIVTPAKSNQGQRLSPY